MHMSPTHVTVNTIALLHCYTVTNGAGRRPMPLTQVVGQHLAAIISEGHTRDAVRANAAPARACGGCWCEVAHTLQAPQQKQQVCKSWAQHVAIAHTQHRQLHCLAQVNLRLLH
jgi:hypothetical protein